MAGVRWYVAAALVLLQALNITDTLLTTRALELGFREANPVMRWVIETMPDMWQFFKIVAIWVCGSFLSFFVGTSKHVDRIVLGLVAVYAVVVAYSVIGLVLVGGL